MGEGAVFASRKGYGRHSGGKIHHALLRQTGEEDLSFGGEGIAQRHIGEQPFGHEDGASALGAHRTAPEEQAVAVSLGCGGVIEDTLLTGCEKIGKRDVIRLAARHFGGTRHQTASAVIQIMNRNRFHETSQKGLQKGQQQKCNKERKVDGAGGEEFDSLQQRPHGQNKRLGNGMQKGSDGISLIQRKPAEDRADEHQQLQDRKKQGNHAGNDVQNSLQASGSFR